MAPLSEIFYASSLPDKVQVTNAKFRQKRRKTQIDLAKCPLMEMVQYSCNPPTEEPPEPGVIKCKSVVRLFRR